MLFDSSHLSDLKEQFGIQITLKHMKGNLRVALEDIKLKGYSLLFINRQYIANRLPGSSLAPSVTTVIINDKISEEYYNCQVFDDDLLSIKSIDKDTLYKAWVFASEFEFLNQCKIDVKISNVTYDRIKIAQFACASIRKSLVQYLDDGCRFSDTIIMGNTALGKFSKNIIHWKVDTYKRLLDCSIYVELVIRQRKFFYYTLKKLSLYMKLLPFKEETIISIIERWEKIKMMLYIIAKRQQIGSIKYLSQEIDLLQRDEYYFTESLLNILR